MDKERQKDALLEYVKSQQLKEQQQQQQLQKMRQHQQSDVQAPFRKHALESATQPYTNILVSSCSI